MKKFDFHDAWNWLCGHPIFINPKHKLEEFERCLLIEVVKVSIFRERISDFEFLNRRTRVWFEVMVYSQPEQYTGEEEGYNRYFPGNVGCDIGLELGAKTFEEAIIKLAYKVLKLYGDYPEDAWLMYSEGKYNIYENHFKKRRQHVDT